MFKDAEAAYDWAERELQDLLSTMEDDELLEIASKVQSYPEIHEMNDFDNYFYNTLPSEVVGLLGPNFSIAADWFYIDEDNLCISFDRLDEVPELTIDIDDIIHNILHDMNDCNNGRVEEILELMRD